MMLRYTMWKMLFIIQFLLCASEDVVEGLTFDRLYSMKGFGRYTLSCEDGQTITLIWTSHSITIQVSSKLHLDDIGEYNSNAKFEIRVDDESGQEIFNELEDMPSAGKSKPFECKAPDNSRLEFKIIPPVKNPDPNDADINDEGKDGDTTQGWDRFYE